MMRDAAIPVYDVTEGDWRVAAYDIGGGVAHIEFTHKGQPFRRFDYPLYKVWNIPAHLFDIAEDFAAGMQLASSTGLEGLGLATDA